jgi:hypothetical protein
MNTSHDCCSSRAVNFSTSYRLMVAWYIRVKTESVVRDTFCAIRVIFTLSGKWRARWYFLLSFVHLILHSGRENDRGNTLRSSSVFLDHVYEMTPHRPPAGMATGQAVPAALSVWAVHPCRLYSAHAVRMSDGWTAKSDCRPLLSFPLENTRWKYGREIRPHSCFCTRHEGIERVEMWGYTSNNS